MKLFKSPNTKSSIIETNPYSSKIEFCNGVAVSSFDESIFDFNYGTVTVITPKGETKADLIILKNYYNFNIDYVDAENEIIYSSTSILGSELDLDSEEKTVKVLPAVY